MSASCEISKLLSICNNTMYLPESLPYEGDNFLPLPIADLPFEMTADNTTWSSLFPIYWTKEHVLEWISYHVEKNQYDARAIDLSCCNMDGNKLCQLSRDDLLSVFGPLGEKLHNHLSELNCYFLTDWNNLMYDLFPLEFQSNNLQNVHSSNSDGEISFKPSLTDLTFPITDSFENDNDFLPDSPNSEVSSSGNSPPSSGFSGSESELERSDSNTNLSVDSFQNVDYNSLKQQKRKRGRPRKISKDTRDCLEGKKSKHSARGSHLWEFIRDILIHPELNEGLLKWEDRSEGIFKFLRSEAVAQLWGQKKKNTSMTYEKLSRAMRYYYKREILERVDGRRLVYKFGKNSSGWKEEESLSNRS